MYQLVRSFAVVTAVYVTWVGWANEAVTGPVKPPPSASAEPARRLPGEYNGAEPVVAADGEGRVVVAAIDRQRILSWSSSDGGKTFGMPKAPLEDSRQQADPWLHAAGPGRFLLSLLGTRGKKTGVRAHLLRSEDGGQVWRPTQEFGSGPVHVDRPIFAMSPDARRMAAISFWSGQLDEPVRELFSDDGAATWIPGPSPLQPPGSSSFFPTGVAINDNGRAVVGYRVKGAPQGDEVTYILQLGVTADSGRTWRRHDLGPLAGQTASPAEDAAKIHLMHSQVGLATGTGGTFHALTTQRARIDGPVELRYWRSADGDRWAGPEELSGNPANLKAYPAIAAAGLRVHAAWLELADGWWNVRYRGSADGGKSWSDCVTVSRPEHATSLQTDRGFRSYSGHYMGVAEDGPGAAHVVWAVCEPGERGVTGGEVWHTIVRLRP